MAWCAVSAGFGLPRCSSSALAAPHGVSPIVLHFGPHNRRHDDLHCCARYLRKKLFYLGSVFVDLGSKRSVRSRPLDEQKYRGYLRACKQLIRTRRADSRTDRGCYVSLRVEGYEKFICVSREL